MNIDDRLYVEVIPRQKDATPQFDPIKAGRFDPD